MPLTEWLAGRLAGELDDHLGAGRPRAARPVPRRRARAPPGRASARAAQSCGPPVGAADPRALVPALRAVVSVTALVTADRSERGTFHPSHRVFDRLGRPGAAHPHRDGRHAAARSSRAPRDGGHRGHPAGGARARARRPTGCRSPTRSCAALARDAPVARAATRGDFDVDQHAQLDRRVARRDGRRDACAGMPPVVRTRHVSTPVNNSWTTRWLYQRATAHVVVTGEALKAQLVRDNGFDPARITSVRTGIDLDRFRPLDRAAARATAAASTRGPAVAIVATLRDWKGHDDLLDAWSASCGASTGGSCSSSATGRAARISSAASPRWGSASDVRFTGNQDDVPAWYACARHRRAAVVRRRGRAAEPHAGGGVRPAGRLDADRRDRARRYATARPACSSRRAT